jgi:uncharacterized coiled-coil DUF342 family protein
MSLKETSRARFWELKDKSDQMRAAAAPLRAERDAYVREARETENEMNAAIRAAEAGLAEIDEELAFLSRALGGKPGPRPE